VPIRIDQDIRGLSLLAAGSLLVMAYSVPTLAADANAGRIAFSEQCSLCHSAAPNDGGGGDAPNLFGVIGRRAASQPRYPYSKALADCGLTWDAATLDRFLNSPNDVVPGSAMTVSVPEQATRENLIAYFQAVKSATPAAAGTANSTTSSAQSSAATTPHPKASASDWRLDQPGRPHRVDVANLPMPFATPSSANRSRVVSKPPGAKLSVPAGFQVAVFATGLQGPRTMRVAPNGDIFVAETGAGRVKVIRPSADGSKAQTVATFAQGLEKPFGMQFYPSGVNPQWLYVAENNQVVRFAYKVGDLAASGTPEVAVNELASNSRFGHSTRDIAFSADGKRLFVSVGSASNVADAMAKKTVAEAQAWEAEHGLGAAWDSETNRADVLEFDMGSKRPGKVFASGIRNCVGLTVEPRTGDLWCTTNERDLLGDDLVPDYSTRVKEGGFYGWPWYYMGNHEDPRRKGDRPDLAAKVTVPDVPYTSHSAPLTLIFYTATSGRSAFPAQYLGDGFAVLHGSWNRAVRTGYKVVRVRMKDGVPTGEYDDFMVGFIVNDADVWGRPVGAAVANDGSLLISEDVGSVIYRISYGH
jgi:glucose/arabinose dehydrogenase/cytochrome c2